MSFKLSSVQGTVAELETDLESPTMHEREEFVIKEVKKAIDHIVTSLGGYLSVSCNGNINPVSGETGDVVDIHIVSLPYPPSVESAQTQPEIMPVETGEPVPVTERPSQFEPQPPIAPVEEAHTEPAPVITENTEPTIPQPAQEKVPINLPTALSGETITPGQIVAQEIAQATTFISRIPPVESNTTDQTESSGVVSPEINTAA